MVEEAGNRVFQTLVVHVRSGIDIKNGGNPRAIAVGQVNCNPKRCSRKAHNCRTCLDEAKSCSAKLIEDFNTREKFDTTGGNHLMGDYTIPVFS